MSNLKGGVVANLVSGGLFILFYVIKNKCRHSQCSTNNCCFTCSIKEDDYEYEEERYQRRYHENVEVCVQKMYKRNDNHVLSVNQKAIPTD